MRLVLVILVLSFGAVFSRYHEKRRFDRSVLNDPDTSSNEHSLKKQLTFTDYDTRYRAYKDREENNCYLEKVGEEIAENPEDEPKEPKTLYAPIEALTKLEAWKIAGGRVIDFCRGRKIILLQSTAPIPGQTTDPFFNIIPQDENDIVTRRVADVVLTPLISRAKREIALEERQKLNEDVRIRSRRQVQSPRGRFRGQTQSQYLNVGGDDQKEGKAEAEATQQSSRAVVSGSRGMGQAQSMSMGNAGCEDCPNYTLEGGPDKYVQHPGAGINYPGANLQRPGGGILPGTSVGGTGTYPGTFPTIGQQGPTIVHPGRIIPGTGTLPSGIQPGTVITDGGKLYQGVPGGAIPGAVPGSVPGATIREGVNYPSGIVPGTTGSRDGVTYTGGIPGTTTGGGVIYPSVPGSTSGTGSVYPGGTPGTVSGSGVSYPGGTPGTMTGNGVSYPGTAPGIIPGRGVSYPGGTPGTTTGGGVIYPGAPGSTTGTGPVYPGGTPGTVSGSGVVYPGGTPGTTTGTGVIYPGGAPGTIGGGVVYPGAVPGTTTGGNVVYPSGTPGTTTGGNVVYPSGTPGTTTGTGALYPGAVPGTTTGGSAVYPGGTPGTTTGGGVIYPGGAPGTTTGTGAVYPGGTSGTGGERVYPGAVPGTAPDTTTGGGVVYPGSIPGTTTGGVVYPGGVPGSTPGGGVVYPGGVPSTTTGGGVVYPGGVPGTTTGGGVVYPGSVPGTGGAVPGVIYPGTTTGGVIYPGSDRTYVSGTKENIPGQLVTGSKSATDAKVYPGQIPGAPGTRVTYPNIIGTGPLPGGVPGGAPTTGTAGVITPGGVINYPGSIQYPGKLVPGSTTVEGTPGTIQTGPSTYPGGVIPGTPGQFVPGDRVNYPGGVPTGIDGTRLYPGTILPGTSIPSGPDIITTGSTSGAGTIVSYPTGTQGKPGPAGSGAYPPGVQTGIDSNQRIGGSQLGVSYPTDIRYPGGSVVQPPGSGAILPDYSLQGQYPAATWPGQQSQPVAGTTAGVPGALIKPGTGQYPSGQTVGQYPGAQYPNAMGYPKGAGDASQYYQQPGGVPSKEDDNSDSQASSSVKEIDSGTQASASAQGKYGQGTAQSQVTGTYTGSGSFSAQAGSSDANKNAQTEISGGKEGATSSAQGTGGYGKSQTQVQLDSESGATSTGAQSSGWNHGTNSQVQASSRGGMADAQANGEGSTSSQAQIGFQPYLKTEEKVEKHSRPFRGGGSASAQSGTYRGQSQSQLEGSFQYGITYTGAAQAGSGSGAAASRKPFNFNLTDSELFKTFKPYNPPVSKDNKGETNTSEIDYTYNHNKLQQGLQSSSSSRKTVIANATKENSQNRAEAHHSAERTQVDDTMYDYEEEYDGEDYDTSQAQTASSSKFSKAHHVVEQNHSDYQSQTIHIANADQYNVHANQNSNAAQPGDVLQPGDSLAGYTIPPGFRGRVKSVAGDETIAHGDGKSQSQTVSLAPSKPNTTREKSALSETRSLKTNHERLNENHVPFQEKPHRNNFSRARSQQPASEYSRPIANVPMKPSYYTVTNSFAGKMDGSRNSPRKYEHRYYTKSSTCGYFTFSCNMVYGSNGRTKICKSKMPTHPDGTPMKC